ncbi:MAG TPA: rhomboid family intramembrane serine protease [Bacteroidia bacterium]|nr:rhomboid family intramembrane serine protease [Bacteroidia bacterium]
MRHSQFPPGVLNLIIINAIFYFAKMLVLSSRGVDLDGYLGLFHPFSPAFHWYQYITSLFMHASVTHLVMNMFGLWLFGHMLENAYGTKRFLIFYFVSGVGASMIFQLWSSILHYQQLSGFGSFTDVMRTYPPGDLLIGASGCVYGVLMGAALLFPNTQMSFLFLPGLPMKLKWVAVLYGGAEVYNAWQAAPGDNVAHFAHVGGMIFGFILVKIYSRDRTHFY